MSSKIASSSNRLEWIDRTKGIAILAIVLFHFFQNYPDRINLVSILDRNGARFAYAAVDIFFIMAGFTTSYVLASVLQKEQNKINWIAWLKKRLARLYPTYFLAVIFIILLYILFNQFKIKSTLNFILSCLGLAGYKFQALNPGFWFFTVILQAYLVIPIIFYVSKNKPNGILWLGIILGVFNKIICFSMIKNWEIFLLFLQTNLIVSYFFQLCLGLYWGLTYARYGRFRKIDITISTVVFTLGTIVYAAMTFKQVNIVYMLGFDMVFTPFFFVMLSLGLDKIGNNNLLKPGLNILSLMGIYSYQIYLLHQPLYITLLPYLNKHININSSAKVLFCMVISIVMIVGYTMAFVYVEKIIRKQFQKSTYKPQ